MHTAQTPALMADAVPDPHPDDLVDIRRFAKASGLNVQTLRGWIPEGRVPRPIKFGNHRSAPIRWRWGTIQAWIAEYEAASVAGASEAPVHAAGGVR